MTIACTGRTEPYRAASAIRGCKSLRTLPRPCENVTRIRRCQAFLAKIPWNLSVGILFSMKLQAIVRDGPSRRRTSAMRVSAVPTPWLTTRKVQQLRRSSARTHRPKVTWPRELLVCRRRLSYATFAVVGNAVSENEMATHPPPAPPDFVPH